MDIATQMKMCSHSKILVPHGMEKQKRKSLDLKKEDG
jgi:hypothetical protein